MSGLLSLIPVPVVRYDELKLFMRKILFLPLVLGLLMVSGCGDGTNGGTIGTYTGGGGDGGNSDDGNGDDDASPRQGCKLVDLVFAVDGSGSMSDELEAMSSDVFPAFATALRSVGGGLADYRVGVLDACPDPANFHTRGTSTSNCNFESGETWMTSNSSDLNGEFACVGDIYQDDVGCDGNNDDEQPASAAATALEGNVNPGFLRNNALLVVVAITDEDEQPSPFQAAFEVYERLVAVKGDVKRIVFLGIGGMSGCTGPYGTADRANKLIDITNLFIAEQRGVFWDLCSGMLEDGLTHAMEVIEQACDELIL